MGLVTVNYNVFDVCTVKFAEIKSDFPCVFDEKLGSLPGGPTHLTLEADPKPVIPPPRTLPESIKDSVLSEMNRHVAEK